LTHCEKIENAIGANRNPTLIINLMAAAGFIQAGRLPSSPTKSKQKTVQILAAPEFKCFSPNHQRQVPLTYYTKCTIIYLAVFRMIFYSENPIIPKTHP